MTRIESKVLSYVIRWTLFYAGLLAIGFLAFVLIPRLVRQSFLAPVTKSAQTQGIDATGLFYTETEEVGEAEGYFSSFWNKN